MITLFIKKSDRKNSKIEMINIVKEHTNAESVLESIISNTDKIISLQKKLGTKKLILNGHISRTFKDCSYLNANEKPFTYNECLAISLKTEHFSSIEQVINFLYVTIGFSDSVYGLSLKTVHESPSIKYLINKFYHSEK